MSIREKLEMMKEINQRNEERRQEFLALQEQRKRNDILFAMYVSGKISQEEFERRYKK